MSSTILKNLVIFLVINFGALALGGLATNAAVNGEWYQSVNKAPWTPPGWVFGAAWTTIMICFSIFMAYAWEEVTDKTKLAILFGIQWILNVGWNPLFFVYHYVLLGLIVISLLTINISRVFLIWIPIYYESQSLFDVALFCVVINSYLFKCLYIAVQLIQCKFKMLYF